MSVRVAIDGPAGSGKSTAARLVAKRLGLPYLDTGATYRLVAQQALEADVPLDDAPRLAELAAAVASETTLDHDGTLRHRGVPLGQGIRTPEVSEAASLVAAHPEVREVLVELQRSLVPPAGAVVEGRDIGTVVLPDAELKAFVDAREDIRALRRARDAGTPTDDARAANASRDLRDATRPVGAMRPAPDALLIDSSDRTPEDVAAAIVAAVPPPRRPNRLYLVVQTVMVWVLRWLFRLEVTGAEHIPTRGPAILAPNHRSLIDIPVVGVLTPRMVRFMAKEELFSPGWAGYLMNRVGAFPVRRGKPDRAALNRALQLLADGELVGVYPEGTRRPTARFDEVEDGVAYLALKSGAPIVPIAISGTEAVMPAGRKLPRLVKIRARIGEPIRLGGPVRGVLRRTRVREATDLTREQLCAVMDVLEPRS